VSAKTIKYISPRVILVSSVLIRCTASVTVSGAYPGLCTMLAGILSNNSKRIVRGEV
jgi:hypothetical protein